MNVRLCIKNANFEEYKYEKNTIYFFYKGYPVGEAEIRKTKVGWRSTKKFNVVVNLNSSKFLENTMNSLASDFSGRLNYMVFTSQSKSKRKVELMKVFKKKRSTEMSCAMEVVIASREVSNIVCN